MARIGFYLVLPFIYLLAILPFPILYLFSDIVYILLYHIIGYRKKVVITNLRNSFPEKSDKEIHLLRKKFYRYLCDLFLETFKTLTISKSEMLKHCYWDPTSEKLLDQLANENKNLILVMGHQGNWEWGGNTFSICNKHQLYVIYHPLSNKYFNALIRRMRERFGTRLIPMKETFKQMVNNRHELNATAFIADQSPNPYKAHWMTFLNQDTAVFTGTEKIAQKLKYPIVYISIERVKRGYYMLKAEILTSPPYSEIDGEITETHTKKLEADIIRQPETWLWSHKRWKHKRPQEL